MKRLPTIPKRQLRALKQAIDVAESSIEREGQQGIAQLRMWLLGCRVALETVKRQDAAVRAENKCLEHGARSCVLSALAAATLLLEYASGTTHHLEISGAAADEVLAKLHAAIDALAP